MGDEMGNQNSNDLQASEQDSTEVTKVANEHSESFIMSKYVDGLKGQVDDTHNFDTKRFSGPLSVSNDAENKNQSTLSVEFNHISMENTKSVQNSTSGDLIGKQASNDNLIPRQASGKKEGEEIISAFSSSSETNRAVSILSVDPKSNEQESAAKFYCESTANSTKELQIISDEIEVKEHELQGAMVNELKECVSNVTPGTDTKFIDNDQDLPLEETRPSGDGKLMENNVKEKDEEGEEQLDFALDQSSQDFIPSQQENALLSEPISFSYLDVIDSEIRMCVEDDQKVVGETSHTEPDRSDGSPDDTDTQTKHYEETSQEQSTTKDMELNSFEIQHEVINLKQKVQNGADGGSENSLPDLVQTYIKEIESMYMEKHDYNPEGKEVLEKGCKTSEDIFSSDKEPEEKVDCGNDGQNDEVKVEETSRINRDMLCVAISTSVHPIIGVTEEMVAEAGTLSATATVTDTAEINILSRPSDNETELLNSDINGGEFRISPPVFPEVGGVSEKVSKKTEEFNVTRNIAEDKSEQHDSKFGGHIEVSDATMFEEQLQTNLLEIQRADSLEASKWNMDLICSPEFEQKKTVEESEMLARKEELIYESDASEYLNFYSVMPNLANQTFVSGVEQEDEKNQQCQNNPSANQMMIQATEASEVEYIELVMNSVMQPQSPEKKSTLICHDGLCVSGTTNKLLESSSMVTTEPNHEKLHSQTGATTRATDDREKLILETDPSPSKSRKEDSEENLLILERDGCEAEKHPTSITSTLEIRAENAKQNPSPDHEQTTKNNMFVNESCINQIRCHTNKRPEVNNKVGTKTAVTVLESTNEESDKSPLLYKNSPGSSEVSGLEKTDSGQLKTPLVSFLKEEVYVLESLERKESLALKKTVEEVWRSPAKRTGATSPKHREKQKPRSSLFSNCMCCTTAIN